MSFIEMREGVYIFFFFPTFSLDDIIVAQDAIGYALQMSKEVLSSSSPDPCGEDWAQNVCVSASTFTTLTASSPKLAAEPFNGTSSGD